MQGSNLRLDFKSIVRGGRIELPTSSMSTKRSTTELTAHNAFKMNVNGEKMSIHLFSSSQTAMPADRQVIALKVLEW
jgi:hypothetical protein